MAATLTRLTGTFDERAVLDVFAREGLSPQQWSNDAGDVYGMHSHDYHKVLFCLRGSITFTLAETSQSYELQAGDRLDIEPHTPHSAVVGSAGVTCIEAPRQ